MELNNVSRLHDRRTNCYSIIFEVTVKDYLNLIEEIYSEKGGISGQREPLKSSSALRIRRQMVKDIKSGAILPPIVVGLVVKEKKFALMPTVENQDLSAIISSSDKGDLTIIDGMQRTTALYEAISEGLDFNQRIRVEFWIATKLNNLIYRMLVLNTGQVPWNLRRQIETVFSSMINEIKEAVPEMEVYTIDDPNRRSKGGQYKADDLIQLYLAFGARKEKVDTKERLADEFTRLDFIEATENPQFADFFYESLRKLALLDIEFSRYQPEANIEPTTRKDIFKSQPARVGFITSIAKKIYGRPGVDKPEKETLEAQKYVMTQIDNLITKIKSLNDEELKTFLALDVLSEKLTIRSSKVGDLEREFFTKAFETFIEEGSNLKSLDVCWLSY